jgi:hypothetical protein
MNIVESGVNYNIKRYNDLRVLNERLTLSLKAKLDELDDQKSSFEELRAMKNVSYRALCCSNGLCCALLLIRLSDAVGSNGRVNAHRVLAPRHRHSGKADPREDALHAAAGAHADSSENQPGTFPSSCTPT